jgi:DNA-binding MarR family transcriptional regulator
MRGDGVKKGKGARARGKNGESDAVHIDFGPLARWIGFNLRMAQEATFQAFSHLSKEVGESPGRFATLTIIARNPGISQTQLSQASGRDKSSVTPVIEDLVRRGLVERKRVRSDRRAWRLKVTANGKKTLATLMNCARAHERNLDRIIGRAERTRFLAVLKKLAAEIG